MSNAQYAAVMGGGTGGVNISTDGTVSAAATNAALAHMPLPIATKVNTNTPTTSTTTQPITSQQTMAARPSGKIAAMERAKACAKAAKYTSIDDERRMKFLALLCGRGAFKGVSSTNQGANVLLSRERSGSIGGMGGMSPHVNDGKNSSSNSHSIGKKQGSSIVNTSQTTQTKPTNEQNYQPTIPSALSRRILHKSGVGYLDNSLPLILSAMSDRFLATILVQAKACRDRRIEGYKATIKERKKRNKHRKLVLKERLCRDKKYKEELSKKRSMMESTVMDAKDLLEKDNNKKGNSSLGGEDKTLFGLSEEEREAIKEYKKQAADIDAEEEYYNKYYGKGEDGNLDLDNISSDEEDDDDDELVVDTDLKLRDLVRPLGAWGFDLTGKLGFTDEPDDDSDGDEYELVDKYNEDGGGSDEDDDEDQDDNVSYSDSSDMGTTDDDEGTGPKSPKKKKPPSPKKKSKAKKASSSGSGTKKSGTTTKKKPAKRKRDESKDDASSKSSGDGKPKAKKAATAASKKTEAATADAKKK